MDANVEMTGMARSAPYSDNGDEDLDMTLPMDFPSTPKRSPRRGRYAVAFILTVAVISLGILYARRDGVEYSSSTGGPAETGDSIREWLDAKVTLSDGIKYEVVDQLVHDPTAFTYVARKFGAVNAVFAS